MEDPSLNARENRTGRGTIVRDIALIGVLTAVVVGVAVHVEAFERLWEFTRNHNDWELDELFVALMVLPFSMSLFAFRRWQELRKEVRRRIAIEADLVRAKVTAEAADRAKSEFLANMSHEIRTPLNGVLGMTQLTLETDLTGEQRDFLTTAASSAHSLLGVLNDILDFSKIEAQRLDLESVDFNLNHQLSAIVKAFAAEAAKKGIELAYSASSDTPEWVKGDPDRLRQVLTNLLSNALKFTDTGEVVLKVQAEEGGGERRLRFTVADTGVGIPKDKQNLVFEAFRQVDGSTTRKYGGTGLGLAICTRLVSMMGGQLIVQSEPGQGSRFLFSLPLTPAEAVPEPPRFSGDPAGLRLLVVDDNATNRRIVLEYVRRWGMIADQADSGSAALAMLVDASRRQEPFELVVVDAMMPQMDGFELCERIGKTSELGHPVLLMLSSLDLGVSAERCRALGISQYVVKPVTRDELFQAICRASHLSSGLPDPETRPAPRTLPAAGLSILLAEDNKVNQLVAARMLERQGHLVEVASDGALAIEALDRRSFDLVLMDVQMPNLDGLEAARWIREKEKLTGEHIPILALTAYALKGDQERCLAAGMDGYLTKPIGPTALQKAIAALMRQHETATP